MDRFENVTVVKKANIYFDGAVTSRTIFFADGSKKTLGIMMPGTYTFGTAAAEMMEIMAGGCRVKLPNTTQWATVHAGESFEVEADSSFEIEVLEITDYCCSYL